MCGIAYRNWITGFIILILTVSGCVGEHRRRPPVIRYGRDVCDECRMIISEERFSAASFNSEGEAVRFDGIGCLIRYHVRHPLHAEKTWVHDYQSEKWVQADSAFFVSTQTVATPMGSGIVAFASQSEAARFMSDHGGTSVEWNNLPALVQTQ